MNRVTQERQFKSWLDEYQGVIKKIARSFANDSEGFDDLYQEILIQLWKSALHFRHKSSEKTWIYRVSFNYAILWKKRESKRLEHISSVDYLDISSESNEPSDSLEYLYASIRRLNKVDRTLILMVLEETSHKEISEIIGISESAVAVRVHRVKKKLLQLIKKYQDGI